VLLVGLLWPRAEEPAVAEERTSESSETADDGGGTQGNDGANEGGHPGGSVAVGADEGDSAVEEKDDGDSAAEEEREAEEDLGAGAGEAPDGGGSEAGGGDAVIDATVQAEPESALAGLARRAAACVDAGDDVCGGTVDGDGAALQSAPWVELEDAEITLIDDYGGAALLRMSGTGATDYYVTVALHDGRWLLRDAYAAAG